MTSIVICKLKLKIKNWQMTSGYFFEILKEKKLEFEKHFEISKKIGNFDKILKFVKQLWNLEKIWKFGKDL